MFNIRLSGLVGAAILAALLLATPALAIDSGGDDTGGSGGGSMSQTTTPTAKPKPKAVAGPTLATARADIDAKNWTKAIADLRKIIAASPNSADAYNLLGYSYRNSGNYDRAGAAYVKALKLNPKHTGALEYQGVLFVKLGQLDKAKANLALIKTISGASSEEYEDLAKAIGG
jgi:Flp pilus assembly protein TadD